MYVVDVDVIFRTIHEVHDEWKTQRWQKFSTKALLDETEEQLKSLYQLPDPIHQWDVYQGLCEDIMIVQVLDINYFVWVSFF